MDRTIIRLLFGYNGSITSREFRIGISILVMLIGTLSLLNLDATKMNLLSRFIPNQLSSFIYIQLSQNYKPSFIPINFILTYSSFILAFKRVRAISGSKTIAIISGIINYLFFASLAVLSIYSIFLYNLSPNEATTYLENPNFIYYTLFLLLVGSINLVFLILPNKLENVNNVIIDKLINVSDYSLKIGMLVLFTLLASFATVVFSNLFGSSKDMNFYKILLRLISLASLFFYFKYSWYRLRDANISVIWLFVALAIFVFIYVIRIWLVKDHPNAFGEVNFIAGIIINILIAAQYSLFLLPSHSMERQQ